MSDPTPNHAAALAQAREFAQAKRYVDAERAYRLVLADAPDAIEALRFVAMATLARGETAEAVALLDRAVRADRSDPTLLRDLGVAYKAAGALDSARYVLQRGIELAPEFAEVRLHMAHALELDKRPELALPTYFRAILEAQRHQVWLDEASTPPHLLDLVRHAFRYVATGRSALFEAAIAPHRAGLPGGALTRVERALAIYLGDSGERPLDPRQKPTFLFVPDLSSAPTVATHAFPWVGALDAKTSALRAELDAVMATREGFEVIGGAPPTAFAFSLAPAPQNATGEELAYWFVERGVEYEANATRCPQTASALANLPLVTIRGHGPDARYAVLTPGAETPTRNARSNARPLAVLPLRLSGDAGLVVGGETIPLTEGRTVVVDGSFGYAFFNRGSEPFGALVFEVWQPDLSAAERAALTDITAVAVDFDTRAAND